MLQQLDTGQLHSMKVGGIFDWEVVNEILDQICYDTDGFVVFDDQLYHHTVGKGKAPQACLRREQ